MSLPVLIVGAGPVGLVAAVDLARRGIPVRIVDSATAPTTEPRAVVVHARSLEMMDALGVVDELIHTGQLTRGLEFHADGATGRIDLTGVDSPYPFTISTPQTETERILRARLEALGVRVEYGRALTALDQHESSVSITLTDSSGTSSTVEASWLVGCDGSHSVTRHLLGETLEGEFKGDHFLMGDVEAKYSADHERMHMFFPPDGGPTMMFPMVGNRVRLIAQISAEESSREATIPWLQQVVTDRGAQVEIESAHWLTVFEIRHAQVPRYRVGRVFLAGDAAHVHSPAGGQGMNTGMQDAFNLGWKLAAVLDGSAPESLLDSYQAERHPIAAHVIRLTTTITDVGTTESRLVRALRDTGLRLVSHLRAVQRGISREIEEIAVNYRESPIVASGSRGKLRAGDAAPDVAGTTIWRDLHPAVPGHTVLLFGNADPTVAPDQRTVRVQDAAIAKRYGVPSDGVVVVRPDGYIGLVTASRSPQVVENYFALLR